ncbi:family 10 glycosylhydrolase [Sphingobacterium spiritivorum]|uniref:family 10 glycosylhydrolase n=1 Tax=Sphingobacterium spiritivorum TaxID=258 RepID=UPI003DA5E8F1
MSNRRNFLKLAAGSVAALSLKPADVIAGISPQHSFSFDYWFWVRPNEKDTSAILKERYKSWKDAGVVGLLFENYSEKHFAIAKEQGLQTHRWMWTMNRGEKELLQAHPEWYAVSRSGKSCATDPAYVNYYRFLCPSHPDVPKYLEDKAREQLEKKDVDGLHLDYIRYPDVVLPVNLWQNYKLDQSSELPDYDFCYSKFSKDAFRKETGIDIDKLEYPAQSLSWRSFRYRQINNVVNRIAEVAKEYHKPLTAAVFPTPDLAKRIVRQDWTNWNLSAVFPMIYHGFYREPVSWIGEAVSEGVNTLHKKFPLYAGLYLPDFKDVHELETAIQLAKENGAAGVSLFGESEINADVLKAIKKIKFG